MEAVHDPIGKPGTSPTTRPIEVRQLEGIVSRLRLADGLFTESVTTTLDVLLAVDVNDDNVDDAAIFELASQFLPLALDKLRTGQIELQSMRMGVEQTLRAPVPAPRARWKRTRTAVHHEVRSIVDDARSAVVHALALVQADSIDRGEVALLLARVLDRMVGIENTVDALRERGAR